MHSTQTPCAPSQACPEADGSTACTHCQRAQVCAPLQKSPSSHGALLSTCLHPAVASQESVVHTFPSSQFTCEPPEQCPAWQVSPVVQALPSSHEVPLETGSCLQTAWPLDESHESAVQALPSSQ